MKRALIVGSLGQDGTLLRAFLLSQGYVVAGLSRKSLLRYDGAEAQPINIADAEAVRELMRQLAPEEVYYLAAYHHSSQQICQADKFSEWASSMRVNAAGPVNFLEAIRLHAPLTRFFYAGSCLVYGSSQACPDEGTPFGPCCAYGSSKVFGANAVDFYREEHGVFAVTGILFNHESHLRPPYFLSRKIVQAAWRIQQGLEQELVLGSLDSRADWGYAPDFVQAFWKSLQVASPDNYVVATGALHSVQDWVTIAFTLAGLDWRRHVREDPNLVHRKREPLVGDISRISSKCGWRPTTAFERMVALMFEKEGRF